MSETGERCLKRKICDAYKAWFMFVSYFLWPFGLCFGDCKCTRKWD